MNSQQLQIKQINSKCLTPFLLTMTLLISSFLICLIIYDSNNQINEDTFLFRRVKQKPYDNQSLSSNSTSQTQLTQPLAQSKQQTQSLSDKQQNNQNNIIYIYYTILENQTEFSSSQNSKTEQNNDVIIMYEQSNSNTQTNHQFDNLTNNSNNIDNNNSFNNNMNDNFMYTSKIDNKIYYYLDQKMLSELKNMQQTKYKFIQNDQIKQNLNIESIKSKTLNLVQMQDIQYGNWCGPDYGGFDTKECKKSCMKDLNKPSEECIKCRPPINYLDRTCMHHDFCQERYKQKVKEEENNWYICENKMVNIGSIFSTRCECTYFIQEKLTQDNLVRHCESLDCIVYGLVVEKAFDNYFFDCACYYKEYHKDLDKKIYSITNLKCVSPNECKKFNGN